MGLLLNYAFSTAPGPLQASTAGENSTCRLNVSVSDPTDTLYCNELLLAVPLGEDAAALSELANVPAASINTAAWSAVSVEVGELLGDDSETTWAKYTYKAIGTDPSEWKIDSMNLVPSLEAIVNQVPGKFTFAIQETSGTDPSKLKPNSGMFKLEKVMPYFYAHSLVTAAPASPTVSKTEFALGEPILIEWESNGTWYELFEKGQTTPIYAGPEKSFSLSNGPQTDTTFVLAASVTGNPAKDKPSTGYETVVLYDEITVTVSNPALTPTKVTASGDLAAGGNLSVKGEATVTGSASVGPLTAASVGTPGALSGGSLAVTGNGSISGTLTAGDATIAGNATVTGDLHVGSLKIGPWTLYEDNDSNLIISQGNEGILITFGEPMSMFVNSIRVLRDGDTVHINNDQGVLDGTTKAGGPGRGWQAGAYWSDSPDGDCDLTVHYGGV